MTPFREFRVVHARARVLVVSGALAISVGVSCGHAAPQPPPSPAPATSVATPTAPAPTATAPPSSSTESLAGLWKAKRWFGPEARGALALRRTGTTYSAEMMGRSLPVRVEKGELSFELPNGEGAFRGKPTPGGAISGHWFPPPSHAQMVGGTYASPVLLQADGANRWRGVVVPFEDRFTFYLLARSRPDGSLGVVLRNPDRDYGAQIGAERLTLTGSVVTLLGKREGQKEERELARGTYDADDGAIRLVFPGRGGSYDFTREGDESDFYPRGKTPARYVYHPPPARDDGWPTGTLEDAGIDRAAIERLIQMIVDTPMESLDTPEIHGVLVARHGKLVLEEYFHGEHRDKLHETRSAAKSLTATLVGAAIHAGAPLAPSTPVYSLMNGGAFPADLEPRKRAMTLEHLLTMSSGYFCDDTDPAAPGNEDAMQDQTVERDWVRYTLKVPMATAPGEKAVYCSINPNLALAMVGRATGESPMDTFDRLLGGPMKFGTYAWDLDPAGQPYGGGGMQLLPRDFMKLGQLMLDGGVWQGHRLVGRDFVARASAPLYHLRNLTYGYLWWGIDYPYKDRTVRAFFAGGSGGQSVMVIPALDLVLATYAGNYASRGGTSTQQTLAPRYILPAVREPRDDKSAPVVPRDFVSPYGRGGPTGPVAPSK